MLKPKSFAATQIPPNQIEDIPDRLTLFVALTPNQFVSSVKTSPSLRTLTAIASAYVPTSWQQCRGLLETRWTWTSSGWPHSPEEVRCPHYQNLTLGVHAFDGRRNLGEGRRAQLPPRWLFYVAWPSPQVQIRDFQRYHSRSFPHSRWVCGERLKPNDILLLIRLNFLSLKWLSLKWLWRDYERGGSTQNPSLHNEWTKVSRDLQHVINSAVLPKLWDAHSRCTLCVLRESELDVLTG